MMTRVFIVANVISLDMFKEV